MKTTTKNLIVTLLVLFLVVGAGFALFKSLDIEDILGKNDEMETASNGEANCMLKNLLKLFALLMIIFLIGYLIHCFNYC